MKVKTLQTAEQRQKTKIENKNKNPQVEKQEDNNAKSKRMGRENYDSYI